MNEKGEKLQLEDTSEVNVEEDIAGQIRHYGSHHKALYRKVDWRILPLMFLCWFLQFLDKVVLNYANIMGLEQSININPDQFAWLATIFFIAYAVAEFPQGVLLQRFPISKVLGFNVLGWGILVCCTAAAQNFAGMAVLRVLLGIVEAVIAPALVMFTSQWYTKRQTTPRIGIWFCGVGAGQIVGGFISYAAQSGSTDSAFEGWRTMFLAVGVFNLFTAAGVIFYLPNSVDTASWLTEEEKSQIHQMLALDQGGNGKQVFKLSSLKEALLDVQVWLFFLFVLVNVEPSGVIVTFSATLIRGFGYSSKQAALLNIPSGVVNIIATLLATYAILIDFPHWLGIVMLMVPTLIGSGLMSFYKGSQGGVLAGIYLLNFDTAPMALIYALIGRNTQGYTKRVATNGVAAIAFGVANIIGPQTFRGNEAPEYVSAKYTLVAVNAACIVLAVMMRLLYGYRNRKRVQVRRSLLEAVEMGDKTAQELEDEDMTDMTNPAFVYSY